MIVEVRQGRRWVKMEIADRNLEVMRDGRWVSMLGVPKEREPEPASLTTPVPQRYVDFQAQTGIPGKRLEKAQKRMVKVAIDKIVIKNLEAFRKGAYIPGYDGRSLPPARAKSPVKAKFVPGGLPGLGKHH